MAVKLDWHYFLEKDGRIVLGDVSFVHCADDDPYRLEPGFPAQVAPSQGKTRKSKEDPR